MPSGRSHDAITFLLTLPSFAAAYAVTRDFQASAVITSAFLFGGLMFGPDLDTVSRQYSRWSVFRFLWLPYRSFFKHRSRFSHGLVFGAFIRVVYFLGGVTLTAFLVSFASVTYAGGKLPGIFEFARVWQPIGQYTHDHFGPNFLILVFVGLWIGAASHTFTDMAGSFIKTGRIAKFL
ncbi:metal-binding protein [soil metagenome]